MLALVVFVSGMSNMSLSTLADDTIQETTAISEETTDTKENKTPAKEDATPAKEDATPAKEDATLAKEDATPAKEDATLAEEDATVWEESTKDVTAELGRAKNPVEKIVDTPLKKAVRAVIRNQAVWEDLRQKIAILCTAQEVNQRKTVAMKIFRIVVGFPT